MADIIDLVAVLVRALAHERDMCFVWVGDEVVVTFAAPPGYTFIGGVKYIIPQADLASRTFPLRIEVPNTPIIAAKSRM